MKRRPALPSVTDHAMLRYLERTQGVDIAAIRRHIAGRVARGVEHGGSAVIVEGVKFVLVENRVVTVLDRRWGTPQREVGDA